MRVLAIAAATLLLAGCFDVDPLTLAEGTGGIMGQLVETTDSSGGAPRPIPDANVLVFRLGALVAETKTNATGHFVVKNLEPKGYEVLAGGSEYDAASIGVVVTAGNYSRVTIEAHPLG